MMHTLSSSSASSKHREETRLGLLGVLMSGCTAMIGETVIGNHAPAETIETSPKVQYVHG
jgi:hypothetical protein